MNHNINMKQYERSEAEEEEKPAKNSQKRKGKRKNISHFQFEWDREEVNQTYEACVLRKTSSLNGKFGVIHNIIQRYILMPSDVKTTS